MQLEAEILSAAPQTRIALGEVHPAFVEPGTHTEFTYFLHPEFTRDSQGFGAIALEASVPLTFRELQIDGTPTTVEVIETGAGLRLRLPTPLSAAERVELHFAATVFQNNTLGG